MTKKTSKNNLACCPPKPLLNERPLLSTEQMNELSGLFKVLTSETRLRLIHALARASELCVTELSSEVGMKSQAVSNQLQLLANRDILASRRDGNQIYYRIIDPCVTDLLDRGLCLIEDSKERKQ